MKLVNKLIENKFEYFIFLLFALSTLWLKEINYLFYNTLESPDIDKYFIYIKHFFDNSLTLKEHGLMYYYLNALNFNIFYSDTANTLYVFHKSIQQVNFYIYLFGLLGYFNLFRFFNFSKISIYLTFIFINFFPPSIAMRLVFKPEILAFAFMPWIIYFIEKYSKDKKIKNLIFCIPFLVSAITLKGNVLVIILVYLFFSYYKLIFKMRFKNFALIILLFFSATLMVTLENNSANGKNILDLQSGASLESKYNFKAPSSIIYKADLYKLLSSPIKHGHADSFIAITLLETNGDYFDLYWDNDGSNYFKNRKNLIEFRQSNEIKGPEFNSENFTITIYQQRNTDVYLYESIGLIISIYLFYLLIKNTLQNKKFRKFLFAAFLGMIVLLFHSITGIPENNFDPMVGDTFKPLYYSFVLIFSFAFLLVILFESKKIKTVFVFVYMFLVVFLLGFPKEQNYDFQASLVNNIQDSLYCEIEKIIYLSGSDFENVDCNMNQDLNISITDTNMGLFKNDLNHKPFNLILIVSYLSIAFYSIIERKANKISST